MLKTDFSDRLEFSWSIPAVPTMSVDYGSPSGNGSNRRALTVRAVTPPIIGTNHQLKIEHGGPFEHADLYVGRAPLNTQLPGIGTILVDNAILIWSGNLDAAGTSSFDFVIPNISTLSGVSAYFQADAGNGTATSPVVFSSAVKSMIGPASGAIPDDVLPLRLAQPSRVEFNSTGTRALVLSRASEDVAMFDITGPSPRFMQIFPRRDATTDPNQLDKNHTPFAPDRLIGDRPTGMVIVDEASLTDQSALLVNNETSRDLSFLVANYTTGVLSIPSGTLKNLVAPGTDKFTDLERQGSEIFADGSRTQTTGNFNNSCESCHFEGGEDGSVWARPNGPRSTIAMYGGIERTGALLWKGVRMNLGETGPMFGGENGGTGVFSDQEQDSLVAYAEKLAVPLNPNLVNADLTPQAKLGRDIYFGENSTNLNPTFRHANCFSCHPVSLPSGASAWFTNDQFKIVDPTVDQAHQDPCVVLKESFIGESIQDVNSGVNLVDDITGITIVDRNGDGIPDIESYPPMNIDGSGNFTRDDQNSAMCDDPSNPGNPLVFTRAASKFDVPTKLGVFFSGPYFHDHAVSSLRAVVDPGSQTFPSLNKLLNTQHDVKGSNVQSFLSSTNVQDDVEALLRFIVSL